MVAYKSIGCEWIVGDEYEIDRSNDATPCNARVVLSA